MPPLPCRPLTRCAVHEDMIGVKKSKAGNDLVRTKKRKKPVRPKAEEYEEWTGFGGAAE
jgi:hypothetical protein